MKKINSSFYQVRVGDINYGNHLANDKMVLLMHDARVNALKAMGFDSESGSDPYLINQKVPKLPGIILTDLNVSFRKEAFLGELVQIDVAISNLTKRKFDLKYTAYRKALPYAASAVNSGLYVLDSEGRLTNDSQNLKEDVLLAESTTKQLFFDYKKRVITTLSTEAYEHLLQFTGAG